MRKGLTPLLWAALLGMPIACGDSLPSETKVYKYQGCPEGDSTCPGEAAFHCAMDTIAKKHNACTNTNQCAQAKGPEASECFSLCSPTAVAKSAEEAYLAEVKIETFQYCQQSRCFAYLNCPRPNNGVVACVDGGCTWIEGIGLDAGRLDAASPVGLDAAAVAGPDAGTPGPDAAGAPGPDAAAPAGPDAAAPAGPDAAAAGPDAAPAGPDAAPAGEDAAAPAGEDAAAPAGADV